MKCLLLAAFLACLTFGVHCAEPPLTTEERVFLGVATKNMEVMNYHVQTLINMMCNIHLTDEFVNKYKERLTAGKMAIGGIKFCDAPTTRTVDIAVNLKVYASGVKRFFETDGKYELATPLSYVEKAAKHITSLDPGYNASSFVPSVEKAYPRRCVAKQDYIDYVEKTFKSNDSSWFPKRFHPSTSTRAEINVVRNKLDQLYRNLDSIRRIYYLPDDQYQKDVNAFVLASESFLMSMSMYAVYGTGNYLQECDEKMTEMEARVWALEKSKIEAMK